MSAHSDVTVIQPGPALQRAADPSQSRQAAGPGSSVPATLALLRALQSSLEPGVVVETFARRLRRHYRVEGLAYDHPEFGRQWGDKGKRAFAARLDVDGAALGRLEIYRQQAFGRRERDELAELAGLLLIPLHNALTHAHMQKQAFADALTGLLNRQALDRMLPRELAAAERNGQPLTLVMMDLDFLKLINDTHGHAAGDGALQCIARAASVSLRKSDMAFRLGGDEFLLLLPATHEAGACEVVERIRHALRVDSSADGAMQSGDPAGQTVGFSCGIATSTPGMTATDLIEQADQAMYQAKRAARHGDAAAPSQSVPGASDFAIERIAAKMAPR